MKKGCGSAHSSGRRRSSLSVDHRKTVSIRNCTILSLILSIMATISTIYDLIAMGHDTLPRVMSAVGNREINSRVKKLRNEFNESEGITTFILPLNDLVQVAWWWWKQPFVEAQLEKFLLTEGNVPEEYLVSGHFEETTITHAFRVQTALQVATDAENVNRLEITSEAYRELQVGLEAQAARTDLTTRRYDCNGGMVLLDKEPLEVKNHRRIHKKYHQKFSACLLAEVKLKFGVPRRTAANQLAIHRYVSEIIKQRGVRAVDAARVIPYIVSASFIPSDDEIGAAAWLQTTLAKSRIRDWTYMPNG